jgi:hypothetical protein
LKSKPTSNFCVFIRTRSDVSLGTIKFDRSIHAICSKIEHSAQMSGTWDFKFQNPFKTLPAQVILPGTTSVSSLLPMTFPPMTSPPISSPSNNMSSFLTTVQKPKKLQWIGVAIGLVAGFYIVASQYLKIRRFNRKYRDNEKVLQGHSKSQRINLTWLSIYDISQLKSQLTEDHDINFKHFKESNVINYHHQTYIACTPFITEYINLVGLKEYWQWKRNQIPVSIPGTEGSLVEYNDANYQIADHYPQIAKDLEVLLNESQLHDGQQITIDEIITNLQKSAACAEFYRQLYAGGCQVPNLMKDIEITTKKLNLWIYVREYQKQLAMVSNYLRREVDLLPEIHKRNFFHLYLRLFY